LIVRVFETEGPAHAGEDEVWREVLQAALVDLHEQPLQQAQAVKWLATGNLRN